MPCCSAIRLIHLSLLMLMISPVGPDCRGRWRCRARGFTGHHPSARLDRPRDLLAGSLSVRHARLMAATLGRDQEALVEGAARRRCGGTGSTFWRAAAGRTGRDGHPARRLPVAGAAAQPHVGRRHAQLRPLRLGKPAEKRSRIQSVEHKQGCSGELVSSASSTRSARTASPSCASCTTSSPARRRARARCRQPARRRPRASGLRATGPTAPSCSATRR